MNQTGIEWCDYTWNPYTGCLHACRKEYCYNTMKHNSVLNRYGARYQDSTGSIVTEKDWRSRQTGAVHTAKQGEVYPYGFDPTFYPHRLSQALRRKNKPGSVFVSDCGDIMGAWNPSEKIQEVINISSEANHHTFLWLTKNPRRYKEFVWPKNCWLGTTVTNQRDSNERIPCLIRVSDVNRFISIEPMHAGMILQGDGEYYNTEVLRTRSYLHGKHGDSPEYRGKRIHQVIVGGETGRDARPMHPDWVRSVRDQCAAAGVPFFFKSWGDVKAVDDLSGGYEWRLVGKKKAGRLLDGREHNDLAWR